MIRTATANTPAADRAGNRQPPAPRRRVLLQFWLVERAWDRLILHLRCFLFRDGKWSATASGVDRGLHDLLAQLARKPPRCC